MNPATEANLSLYQENTETDVGTMLQNAHQAFLNWREMPFSHRRDLMTFLATLLRNKKEAFALLIANEMGKPITQGQAEIEKCAWVCDYFAQHAATFLQPRMVVTEFQKSKVCYQPLGVIFAIMPWNFPFWQVFRCVVPALMAGNAAILKHASITTGCGLAIEGLFKEAGFEPFLFQQAIVGGTLAAKMIAHDTIVGLSFTGSENVGRTLAANAASHLKKSVLELGGSDPYVVLADADLDVAADCIVRSRLNNCGQVCIAAKRAIAVNSIHDELLAKIEEKMMTFQMGSPLDAKTTLGPMARGDLRQSLHKQVMDTIKQGAKLVVGGKIPAGKGFYYPATLIAEVRPGMIAFEEELFGPVIALIRAEDESEAIQFANQSRFGLAAAIFTRDIIRGEAIATEQIEAGTCVVNAFVASDPRLPFGGIKKSGFGRELSREGLLEFVNVKTVAVQ